MNFKDKFKPGDIICSDHFRNGLCMVVERLNPKDIWEDSFTCQDLVEDHQKWRAYEFDKMLFNRPNDWRIATDDDIVKYLSRHLIISYKVGEYEVRVLDNCLAIEGFDCTLYLEADELIDLKRIIDERVQK